MVRASGSDRGQPGHRRVPREVHSLLEDSELLLTAEGSWFRSGGPGADFKDDLAYWTDDPLYDENKSLEENIRDMGAYREEGMTA